MKILGKGEHTYIVEVGEYELMKLQGFNPNRLTEKLPSVFIGQEINVHAMFDALERLRNIDVASTLKFMQETYKEIAKALEGPVMPATKPPQPKVKDKPDLTVDYRPDLIASGETVKVPPHPLVIE